MQIAYNRTKRNVKPKYIVVHDTGNKSKGADAEAHYKYFNSGDRQSSADIFVDDKQILKVNDYHTYYTWHCGDGKGKYGITNANSVAVEICINSDGDYDKAVKNAVKAVKDLMKELNIPAENVVRHYDASRKNCPGTMSADGWKAWSDFKNSLKEKKKKENAVEIVNELIHMIEILDVESAIYAVQEAREKNNSLYWILYKIVNKE